MADNGTGMSRGQELQARLEEQWQQVKPRALRLTREIIPGVFQVRTRGSRAYLLVDDKVTLVDCGNVGSGPRIASALNEVGRELDDVETIVITHCHVDHVGGLPELQQSLRAKTAVHRLDASLVESEQPLPNPSQHPLVARLVDPWLTRMDPGAARVDCELEDGDELPAFGGLRVVHAPGHTPGSISLHFPGRGLLLVGDALQHKFGRLMLPSRLWTEDMATATESVHKLGSIEFETLCFSHFRPILTGAAGRVRELSAALADAS